MPRKKQSQKAVEQKQYHIFDPKDVKKAIEIPVKEKPSLEELQTIEKLGNVKKKVNMLPSFSLLSKVIFPPMRSAYFFTMFNPSPEPPY